MLFPMRTITQVPLTELRRQVDRLLDEFSTDFLPFSTGRNAPALNVWENGETLYAEAEVPGTQMSDLEITVVGNELTLKGRRTPTGNEKRVYHRQERPTAEFSRTVTLPAEIDADKVEATLHDGLLRITLPKAAAARARKIAVRAM